MEICSNGHDLIGEYVVFVTGSVDAKMSRKFVKNSNKMVEVREGISDRFIGVSFVGVDGYFVIRKLIVGDPIDFIDDGLRGADRKAWWS